MITDRLYKVRVGKGFEVKTVNGEKIKYSDGQWIVGKLKDLHGKLMLLSEGIYFRPERFDQIQEFDITTRLELKNDTDMAFHQMIEQYLHQKNHHCDEVNYCV